jgi:putative transposase
MVLIVPCVSGYKIQIVYEKQESTVVGDKSIGVDIGLNNLASCVIDNGTKFIINGKPLKSINQYYNKKKSKLQSKLPSKQKTSRKINKLTDKRNKKIKDYMHKASNLFINKCSEIGVSKIVIGHNEGWKQEINIAKRNNQNFVSIPFNMFIEMISYK